MAENTIVSERIIGTGRLELIGSNGAILKIDFTHTYNPESGETAGRVNLPLTDLMQELRGEYPDSRIQCHYQDNQ
ncbi:hypothetical protein J4466_01545 [Candidatus Pacearchaeota archaeon]|nr:hypothetical protein [Candidatus Pacearchaeota archaeon]